MSMIVRSLLAVILLVTATAKKGDNCATKTIGYIGTSHIIGPLPRVDVASPAASVAIPLSMCTAKYKKEDVALGEVIRACNNNATGPAPNIWANEGSLSPIFVSCVDGCPLNATVDVLLFCYYL